LHSFQRRNLADGRVSKWVRLASDQISKFWSIQFELATDSIRVKALNYQPPAMGRSIEHFEHRVPIDTAK
jgi:hypothetical protein